MINTVAQECWFASSI